MSEQNNKVSAQEEMMRRLKAIGADLWGGIAPAAEDTAEPEEGEELEADIEKAWRMELAGQSGTAAKAANLKSRIAAKKAEKKGEAPEPGTTVENLWITADETVDWTEALLRETPSDGLTGQRIWSFYHRMAPAVLEGKTEAYAEVLTTVNPLGDISRYTAGMVLRTPSPERVECEFECQRDDLEKYGRDYLGALSLRIARDLLAVLPVDEVAVTGKLEEQEKVQVVFRRNQLMKKKMAFLQPADFLEACGGTMKP